MGLELGEGHLDRIEVGRVLGKEQKPGAAIAQGLGGAGALVDGEIVQDHDVAALERRRELALDVEVEGVAIHRAIDHPGRDEPVAAQAGDEGLRVPTAERRFGAEPLAAKERPRRRVIFVATAVSSMNTSRDGARRMRGWRFSIQMRRRSATSGRSRSEAISAFFI